MVNIVLFRYIIRYFQVVQSEGAIDVIKIIDFGFSNYLSELRRSHSGGKNQAICRDYCWDTELYCSLAVEGGRV